MTDTTTAAAPAKRKKTRGTHVRVLAFLKLNGPSNTAEIAEQLDMPLSVTMDSCRTLTDKNQIHRSSSMLWTLGPLPAPPRVERHVPGPLEPAKHWTADIPPERLAAFKLPSRELGRLVYPKDYPK